MTGLALVVGHIRRSMFPACRMPATAGIGQSTDFLSTVR